MVAFQTLDQLYSRVHGGRPEADVLEHLVGALGLLLAGLAPRLTEHNHERTRPIKRPRRRRDKVRNEEHPKTTR